MDDHLELNQLAEQVLDVAGYEGTIKDQWLISNGGEGSTLRNFCVLVHSSDPGEFCAAIIDLPHPEHPHRTAKLVICDSYNSEEEALERIEDSRRWSGDPGGFVQLDHYISPDQVDLQEINLPGGHPDDRGKRMISFETGENLRQDGDRRAHSAEVLLREVLADPSLALDKHWQLQAKEFVRD